GGYQQYKSVEVDTHPQPFPNKGREKQAFTLAEVLITLAIIGVVAAMTIPTLVANYQQRSWDTASSVFNRRLGEALKVMNVNSNLAGFDSTQAFVDELGKHIKITRTCDSEHLTDCFAETITTSADPIETKKLKQAKNLNSANDYGTETIGVQFADGVSALIAYNKSIVNDPYSNEVVKVTGTDQKSVGLDTQALSILYDVSGAKTPNSYGTNKDIRGLNIAIKTGASVQVIGTGYSAVNCADSTSEGYEYCTANDVTFSEDYGDNYWVGAKKACADIGMSLPAIGSFDSSSWTCNADSAEDTLCGIYNNRDEYGITSGWFWSS
ncbi:type II secretion system protein, partial [bacterium]|nr:type II secretion system protein [bacterium]